MSVIDMPKSGYDLLGSQTIVETSERRIRVQFNSEYIADSTKTFLLRRGAGRLNYYFPEQDVRMKHLVPRKSSRDDRNYFDVRIRDTVAKGAAWKLHEPTQEMAVLDGYIAFHWNRMDHWFEEEEEIFGHPRDPYHRVDARHSTRRVRVEVDGIVLADSDRPTIVFETGLPARFYLPLEDVSMEHFQESQSTTICPYKGQASYWSAMVKGETYRNLVWAYADPLSQMKKIEGLVCFFNEKVDLFVDGELQERPKTPWSDQRSAGPRHGITGV